MTLFRRLTILVVIFISSITCISAGSDTTSTYKRSFGYGVSNLIELYDPINYRVGIYLDFSQKSPWEGWTYNIKFTGKYRLDVQNNLRYHEIRPFITTVGLERNIHLEKIVISLQANLFYSMTLRKSSVGAGSGFQGDDYGVGLAPGLSINLPLRENLWLCGGFEYGVGFFREFVSLGTVTQPTLVFKGIAIRNLSFGIRHYF